MLVHIPSYSFFFLNALTVILTYSKLEGDLFFFTWQMSFVPTFLYLIILSLKYLKRIIILDEGTYKESYSLKTNRFQLLDHFFHLVLTLTMLFIMFYASYILDNSDLGKTVTKKPLYVSIALYLIVQFAYTHSSKSLEKESLLPMSQEKKHTSLYTTVMSPILNFLGTSFMFCQGGTCSSIYGSTISAIFSAFGISISEWLPVLDWLTFLLVLVSVGVLYYAKKSLTYKPFLISVVAAVIIFSDQLFFQKRWPVYIANVLMIGAALWNSKLNKAGFFFGGKKKKAKTEAVATA